MGRIASKGNIVGAIGNLIFYEAGGQQRVRTKPGRVKNPQTPAQQEHRQRFALASRFVKPFRALLDGTFASFPGSKQGFGAAMSYNMRFGIMGQYPHLSIDYQQALISFGALPLPDGIAAHVVKGGIQLIWNPVAPIGGHADDWIYPVVWGDVWSHCEAPANGVPLKQGSCFIPCYIDSNWVHVWVYAKASRGREVSKSRYVGRVELLQLPS